MIALQTRQDPVAVRERYPSLAWCVPSQSHTFDQSKLVMNDLLLFAIPCMRKGNLETRVYDICMITGTVLYRRTEVKAIERFR